MQKLRDNFIKQYASFLVFVTAVVTWFNSQHFPKSWQSSVHLLEHYEGQIIILVLAGAGYLLRWRLWRVFSPALDVSGIWFGQSIFEFEHSEKSSNVAQTGPHEMRIEQEALSIRLMPTINPGFRWTSIATELTEGDNDALTYAYLVRYDASDERPIVPTIGVERLTIIERASRKKPDALAGTFAHCVERGQKVYSGRVYFARSQEGLARLLHRQGAIPSLENDLSKSGS